MEIFAAMNTIDVESHSHNSFGYHLSNYNQDVSVYLCQEYVIDYKSSFMKNYLD